MAGAAWATSLYRLVDERLRDASKRLQRGLTALRVLVFLLVLGLLGVYVSAVGAIVRPDWLHYWFAGTVVVLSLPLVVLTALVALPLRLRSVTRLIDKGYPENAKELALRVAARKLHDESIETEELLLDTAINEGRKAVRKYKPAVEELLRKREQERQRADAGPEDAGADDAGDEWRGEAGAAGDDDAPRRP